MHDAVGVAVAQRVEEDAHQVARLLLIVRFLFCDGRAGGFDGLFGLDLLMVVGACWGVGLFGHFWLVGMAYAHLPTFSTMRSKSSPPTQISSTR